MTDLVKYYTSRIITLAVFIAIFMLLIDNIAIPRFEQWLGKDHLVISVVMTLTSRISILIAMVLGEMLIRNYLWKIEHPELDFSGKWEGETIYRIAQVGEGPVPFSSHHFVLITQNCLSIKISPTTSEEYVNWGSLALELSSGDTLKYAYWVNYSNPQKFPERAKGYEEMKVTKRGKRNRPIEMTGEFFHCAQGMSPIYSGDVKFNRV